jgi:hypothetical protein
LLLAFVVVSDDPPTTSPVLCSGNYPYHGRWVVADEMWLFFGCVDSGSVGCWSVSTVDYEGQILMFLVNEALERIAGERLEFAGTVTVLGERRTWQGFTLKTVTFAYELNGTVYHQRFDQLQWACDLHLEVGHRIRFKARIWLTDIENDGCWVTEPKLKRITKEGRIR